MNTTDSITPIIAQIEKNIPIPMQVTSLLRALMPGDSVLIPRKNQKHVSAFAKQLGIVCITRSEPTLEGFIRVWRKA